MDVTCPDCGHEEFSEIVHGREFFETCKLYFSVDAKGGWWLEREYVQWFEPDDDEEDSDDVQAYECAKCFESFRPGDLEDLYKRRALEAP